MIPTIKIKKLHPAAQLPAYATPGAACFDLRAAEGHRVPPNAIVAVGTGLAMEIPEGWRLDLYSRSGHALRAICLANGVGKIDSDYRGEVMALIANRGEEDFIIRQGDRIAQGEINPVVPAVFEEAKKLEETERGVGGFGSTGS